MKTYLVTATYTHLGQSPVTGEFDDAQSAQSFADEQLKTSPLVIIKNQHSLVTTHLRNKLRKV